jgi:dCMP deaminase
VRPDRDEWHLDGADWLARMGDCTRRKVGALIVVDKRFVGLGYNGTRPGEKGCLEGACPRGRHWKLVERGLNSKYKIGPVCACGRDWPCPDAVPPGSSYDTGRGACIASHAEQTALADAQRRGAGLMTGGTMYVSCEPCEGCIRQVRNTTEINTIIWPDGAVGLP